LSSGIRLRSLVIYIFDATSVCLSRLAVIFEHLSQYIFSVLESFGHIGIGRLHCCAQMVIRALPFFVDIGHHFGLRVQHDLGVILEIHLNYFAREAEHNGVAGPDPLFDIDGILKLPFRNMIWVVRYVLVNLGFLSALQIASEMLEKSNFLLKLLRVLRKFIFLANILMVGASRLIIIKMAAVRI